MPQPLVVRNRKGQGADQTGRSTKSPPFVMLRNYVFDCPAYRSLKPGPRALLFELVRRYDGSNNGRIGLGARGACVAVNIADKDTAVRYFDELQDHGFIRPTKLGAFNMKVPGASRATEWRLTWLPSGNDLPTKEFMKWKPK